MQTPPGEHEARRPSPRLPNDLPTSLDDRRNVPEFLGTETEVYDAWSGKKRALDIVLVYKLLSRT